MIEIKKATPQDIPTLYRLIRGLAAHHEMEQFVLTSERELEKAGFQGTPVFEALIAKYQGQPAGFVSYTENYSIWLGQKYVHIDDVFTRDEYRGKGIGKMMMETMANVCREKGLSRLKWTVEPGNESAIRFYERLGAQIHKKGLFTWQL